METRKIRATHLARTAIVYLRQSTLRQVFEHRESTQRQYALADRARDFGWNEDRVEVVDEDLGLSGATTQHRTGFRYLAEAVSNGQVGAIFALEVSRFARSSADWHRLLDLCGVADTLIVDDQGTYDPGDPNDRLLLGLKGQMSEAERYWLRLRLHGAKLSRARRGELPIVPPAGYVWDHGTARLEKDPDEQVREVIRLIFKRFRVAGTGNGVRTWLIEQGLKLPVRRSPGVDQAWVVPSPRTVQEILLSPIYAGAYVYGRRELRSILVDGKVRRKLVRIPMEEWKVLLHDQHPAYIPWEEYLSNVDKLHQNRRGSPGAGAARDGSALLQGLVVCGVCGSRMGVRYNGRNANYACKTGPRQGTSRTACWSVSATRVDEAVEQEFLRAAQPQELEIALEVAREAERQAAELGRQWSLRVERARYDAKLAERRYKAVDPDNRIVARTLESEWEEKLVEVTAVERDYAAAKQKRGVVLTEEDQHRIRELARDLPQVWRASSTTWQQRKNLLRLLLRQAVLTPIDVPTRRTRIQLLWEGDQITERTVDRPRRARNGAPDRGAEDTIRTLAETGRYDDEIADHLNAQGSATGGGRAWSSSSVGRARRRLHVSRPDANQPNSIVVDQRADGLYSARGVAARMGVSTSTVRSWIQRGILSPTKGGGQGRTAWFDLNDPTVAFLEAQVARAKPLPRGAS